MSTRPLSRLFDDPTVERLREHGIVSSQDFLCASTLQLSCILDVDVKIVNQLVKSMLEKISPLSITALDMLRKGKSGLNYLRTGIDHLDEVMKGGIPPGMITEISGTPGSGKSQFCMGCLAELAVHDIKTMRRSSSMLSSTSIQFTPSSSVIFDTEHKFNAVRLREIIEIRAPDATTQEIDAVLSHISIRIPLSCKMLKKEIEELQRSVIENKIKLICIDSVAALTRKEGLQDKEKDAYLVDQANTLKFIGEICQCFILITNQMSLQKKSVWDLNKHLSRNWDRNTHSTGHSFTPKLGPTWYHCISIRLVLEMTNLDFSENNMCEGKNDNHQDCSTRYTFDNDKNADVTYHDAYSINRSLLTSVHVTKSPFLATSCTFVSINSCGMFSI